MTKYNYTGATQFVTVTETGLYNIEADGAQGGTYNGLGGMGASVSAIFFLTEGTRLALVTGEQGHTAGTFTSGGGGASWVFVVNADGSYTPLVVAGGGGGGTVNRRGGGAEEWGGSGLGGSGSGRDGAGGGTGFLEVGSPNITKFVAESGPTGGLGGYNLSGNFAGGFSGARIGLASGGFGGGGGGSPVFGLGGGGGGYTGGDGGSATGGTSYVAQNGLSASLQGSNHAGNGQITIAGAGVGAVVSATQALYDTTKGTNTLNLPQGRGDTFGYSFTTQGQAVMLTGVTFGVFDPGGGSGFMEVSLRANGSNNTPGEQLASLGFESGDNLRDGEGTRLNSVGLSYQLAPNTTYWIVGKNDPNSALQAAVNFDAGGVGDAYAYGRFYSAEYNATKSFYNNDTYNGANGFSGAQVGRIEVSTFASGYVGVTAGTTYDPGNATDKGLLVYTDPGLTYTASLSGSTLTVSNGTKSQAIELGDGPRALKLDFSPTTGDVNLTGGAFGDDLRGGSGDDLLQGGGGDDLLEGGVGVDALFGQSFSNDPDTGIDTASYAGSSAGVTVDLGRNGPQTSAGDANGDILIGIENLVGSAFADTLTGDAKANTLAGGSGDDLLQGGGGDDVLEGGAGGDLLFGQSFSNDPDTGTDTARYAGSGAGVTVDLGLNTVQASAGDASGDFLIGIENLVGSAFADTLTGDAKANGLSGGAGADTLIGKGGNDRLDGGLGPDRLEGGTGDDTYLVDDSGDGVVELAGEGFDTVLTSLTSYTLGASVEALTYTSTGFITGSFTGTGNELANRITGDLGADTLDGGGGADTLIGRFGDDTYIVDDVGDVVIEEAGDGFDTVRTSLAGYTLGANVEALAYTGTASFTGTGNELANRIVGGTGDDVLDGKAGDDSLTGGAGADTFVFERGTGQDIITDFATGSDVVRLVGLGVASFAQVQAAMTQVGSDTRLALPDGSQVTFLNHAPGDFSARDFGLAASSEPLPGAPPPSAKPVSYVTLGAGDDTLLGDRFNNYLNGGGGRDTASGGLGDDTYAVEGAGDTVIEKVDEGIDTVESYGSYVLSANVENLKLVGLNLSGTGNELANAITGGRGNDILNGKAGNDYLTGGAGGDTFVFERGTGHDVVTDFAAGSAGTDVVKLVDFGFASFAEIKAAMTQVGADTQLKLADNTYVSFLNHTISDFTADDFGFVTPPTQAPQPLPTAPPASAKPGSYVYGTAGNDTLDGNQYANFLNGYGGQDTTRGGRGDDTYGVENQNDTVIEFADEGIDTVESYGSYALSANVENLKLVGIGLTGTGNELANAITGGRGNDILNGKAGNDYLTGGAGGDTFVFERGTGHDVITDFAAGSSGSDVVNLRAFSYSSFDQVKAGMVQAGETVQLKLQDGSYVSFLKANLGQFDAGDFVL